MPEPKCGFFIIMAKELPYFKFEPNAWDNGNIQLLTRSIKGLFIDICSTYWSRLGEMPYALALQKHCNGNTDELQQLVDLDILLVKDGQIVIEFLDEQLNEFQETSEKRRFAANKRWKNASAMQVQCKSNAIREEEIREEDIYRRIKHLKLTVEEFNKLEKKYTKEEIDSILDDIENYKNNKNYTSLYLTANKWLKKSKEEKKSKLDENGLTERQRYMLRYGHSVEHVKKNY